MTLILGFSFTVLQSYEYVEAPFTIRDGVYGSIFYVGTGFHGLHVVLGSCFLLVCTLRLAQYHFNTGSHVGFELAIWY